MKQNLHPPYHEDSYDERPIPRNKLIRGPRFKEVIKSPGIEIKGKRVG